MLETCPLHAVLNSCLTRLATFHPAFFQLPSDSLPDSHSRNPCLASTSLNVGGGSVLNGTRPSQRHDSSVGTLTSPLMTPSSVVEHVPNIRARVPRERQHTLYRTSSLLLGNPISSTLHAIESALLYAPSSAIRRILELCASPSRSYRLPIYDWLSSYYTSSSVYPRTFGYPNSVPFISFESLQSLCSYSSHRTQPTLRHPRTSTVGPSSPRRRRLFGFQIRVLEC
ncbi:hypothetical protein FA15DRAFT_403260 [Coprinopsis marcescibilis]|uniref:Uncharacterized protein n=1 Tax=Coprinopsis marcescibilis TaxID=230819 RepID=A0A5C3KWM5_COPMA|nr:hypothetical protein FA15DRAFT_403260 [Coprinopsis marcescibilis]